MKENHLKEVQDALLERYGLSLATFFILFFSFFLSLVLYTTHVDIKIHAWAMEVFPPGNWQELWGYLSRAGQAWFQVLVCVVVAIIYYYRCNYRMSRIFYTAIPIFLVVGLVNAFFKNLFGRPRPKLLETMYDFEWFELASRMHSFPSGHTVTTFCLLATVMPFYGRKVQIFLFLLASTISFARVGIGSHYMGDVVAGAVIGYAFGSYLRTKMKLEQVRNI